ncbi:MAG: hypothetical protein AAGC93_21495 [Cyanobacteria bacterium P01_F01_bin.53]
MSQWAALVYGRTSEVDFRFISVPIGFTVEDRDWAWKYIRPMMRSAESLYEQPRWCLFENEKYCIFGVSCMASDLVEAQEENSIIDITRDSKGRALYVFVGYVLKKINETIHIPQYSSNSLSLFKPLYNYVEDQWSLKSFQLGSKNPIESVYEERPDFISSPSDLLNLEQITPNYQSDFVALWSSSEKEKSQLWHILSQKVGSSSNSDNFVSLCLGLAAKKEFVSAPFLNGTVIDDFDRETIKKRYQPHPSDTLSTFPIEKDYEKNEFSKDSASSRPGADFSVSENGADRFLEAIGALGGAALASKVFRVKGVLGCLIGGGLGWITTGWLSNKGVGGYLRSVVDSLIGLSPDTNLQREDSDNRNPRRQGEPSRDEVPEESVGDRYGFRRKDGSAEEDSDWFS